MMKARPTSHADAWGIMDGYEDALHRWHRTPRRLRAAFRAAMGVDTEAGAVPPAACVRVLRAGQTQRLVRPSELTLEDGTVLRVNRHLPSDLPIGYHTLRALDGNSAVCLIVSPGRCHLPENLKAWGWALQLYALRSGQSWGMGDLADLRTFARWSGRELGAGFILLNPIGAPLPVMPQEASPYFPSSRLYRNPLYLRVEEVPGAAEARVALDKLAVAGRALNGDRIICRDAIFRLKMAALEKIWTRFRGNPAFDRFRAEQGKPLDQFVTFCVLAEHHDGGWRRWPARFRRPDSAAVRQFAAEHERRLRFHQWLQWLLDEQLARASKELPLMLDLPIGVDPTGADAWAWQDMLAQRVTVGAPPDEYNTLGQNWGLPPFVPHKLRAAAYEPFRQTIRAALRHAGGLRIDHVMGLFRLFWIPHGGQPRDGTYVRYLTAELLALLAIESQRAKAVIVGEDLGTVEKGVRSRLHRHGILSYRLLWFEKQPPEHYPPQALAAVTTHDLFTIAGLWTGRDLETQEQLGLHPNVPATLAIRRRLRRSAGLSDSASPREAVLRAHRLLARAPCKLLTATLDDALAIEERPNTPGTKTRWPNWSIALPQPLEVIKRDQFLRKVAKVMLNRTGSGQRRR